MKSIFAQNCKKKKIINVSSDLHTKYENKQKSHVRILKVNKMDDFVLFDSLRMTRSMK